MEFITDPVFIWASVLTVIVALIIILRYISKKTGVNTDDLQDCAKNVKEIAERNLEKAVLDKYQEKK